MAHLQRYARYRCSRLTTAIPAEAEQQALEWCGDEGGDTRLQVQSAARAPACPAARQVPEARRRLARPGIVSRRGPEPRLSLGHAARIPRKPAALSRSTRLAAIARE